MNADGQPLVLLSRYLCANPLPEQVATTDLFPAVARLAAQAGVTFYMLGATEEGIARRSRPRSPPIPGCGSSAAATVLLSRRRGGIVEEIVD